MSTQSPLARWLAYLGIEPAALSRKLGLHRNAVGLAAERGSRKCGWIKEASLVLGVPDNVLTQIDPLDPRAGPYRAVALEAAANERLAEARRRKRFWVVG